MFGGWREHSNNARTSANAVIMAALAPAGALTVSASAVTNLMKFAGALTRSEFENTPEIADPTYVKRDERRFNRVGRLGISLDQGLGEHHRISAMAFVEPKYLQRSERNTYRDFNRYHVGGSASYAWMATFGPTLASTLQMGIDEAYQDGSIQFYSLSASNFRGSTLLQNKSEGANTFGAFVQEELRIGEDWSFVAGARFDFLRYQSEDNMASLFNASKEFKALTPKLGISWRVAETHSIYASLGGGVEAPAFNEIDPQPSDSLTSLNPLLEPMTSTVVEAGIKGITTLDGTTSFLEGLQYEVAWYYLTVKNDLVPFGGGKWYFTAGASHRTGVEASVTARTSFGLSLLATLTAGSNVYDEYTNDVFGDLSGKKVAGLPDLFGGARLRYTSPWKLYAEIGVRHSGSYFAEDTNTDNSKVDASSIFDAGIGGSVALGPLGIDGFAGIDNLTNAKYVGSVFINGANGRYFEPGLPSNTHMRLRLRWAI
jgi:iron complex outermembrane receptor protein